MVWVEPSLASGSFGWISSGTTENKNLLRTWGWVTSQWPQVENELWGTNTVPVPRTWRAAPVPSGTGPRGWHRPRRAPRAPLRAGPPLGPANSSASFPARRRHWPGPRLPPRAGIGGGARARKAAAAKPRRAPVSAWVPPAPSPRLPQPCPCLPGTEPGRTEPSRHQAAPRGAPLRAPSAPWCPPSPRGRLPCPAGVELNGGCARGAEGPRLRPVSPGADGEARGVRWARGLAGGGCPVRAVPSAGCSRSVRPWCRHRGSDVCRLSLAGSGRQLCTDGYWPDELALLRPWCGARLERASLPADLYSRESAYLWETGTASNPVPAASQALSTKAPAEKRSSKETAPASWPCCYTRMTE